jgi:hypothetical protein
VTHGIRVRPLSDLSDLIPKRDGWLFHIGAPGVVRTIRPRIRSLERLAPAARAGRAGRSATDYAEFRQRYWRQLEVEYDICGSPDCMEPRAKS